MKTKYWCGQYKVMGHILETVKQPISPWRLLTGIHLLQQISYPVPTMWVQMAGNSPSPVRIPLMAGSTLPRGQMIPSLQSKVSHSMWREEPTWPQRETSKELPSISSTSMDRARGRLCLNPELGLSLILLSPLVLMFFPWEHSNTHFTVCFSCN
jgi:hypothetical protein